MKRAVVFVLGLATALYAFAFLPAAVGATTMLAPAMRVMLARATEGAAAMVGSSALRASVLRTAPIAGVGVPVTVSRTVPIDSVFATAVLATGGYFLASNIAEKAGLRFTSSGILMDPGQPKVLGYSWAMGNTPAAWNSSPYRGISAEQAHSSYVSAMCAAWTSQPSCGDDCVYRCVGAALSCSGSSTEKTCVGGETRQQVRTTDGYVWANSPISGTYYRNDAVGADMTPGCPSDSTMQEAAWDSGRCHSLNESEFEPATVAEAAQRLLDALLPGDWVDTARDAADAGVELPGGSVSVEGPATVQLPQRTSTTTRPDGSTETVVESPVANVTYEGDRITWNITTTTTTTINRPGEPPEVIVKVDDVSTSQPPVAEPNEPQEDKECGLPGTPKCAIDETGTPPAPPAIEDPDVSALTDILGEPPVADTSWSFSFALPSSCSVLSVGIGAWTVPVDLCKYQPIIHDILSMVWVAAGVWFAIGMVGRTLGSA